MKDWINEHKKVIEKFLNYLNKESENYILKGGTALLMCYKLDRFSEDIDLDGNGKEKNIEKIISNFCEKNKYSYRKAKDTETTFRSFIKYNNNDKPLKIEVSFRNKSIDIKNYTKINGINVYNINNLCMMKTQAYIGRDKIRDLYDLSFIINNYDGILSDDNINSTKNAVSFKGIEQFDYIIKTQKDDLIDNNKLADDFLKMYNKLELIEDSEKIKQVENIINDSPKIKI